MANGLNDELQRRLGEGEPLEPFQQFQADSGAGVSPGQATVLPESVTSLGQQIGAAPEAPNFREVSEQAFESAVSPLRRSFEDRLTGTTESLAQRGIQFGDLGNQQVRKLLEEQGAVEADVAGRIGSTLGQTALSQAFQASEAAKSRSLQGQLAQAGFESQAQQADIGRQTRRNEQAIQLALRGNLTGEGVNQLLQQTFGPGTVLTTQDEADFDRVARASGLTPDEFQQMRRAIGEGQLLEVLQNTQDFVDSPEKARQFQLELARMTQQASRRSGGGGSTLGTLGQIAGAVGSVVSLFSDERLKDRITSIDSKDSLDIINKLRPVSFNWKKDGIQDFGLIAQEVERVLPQVVHQDKNLLNDYKQVNYNAIFSILIQAVKELSNQLEEVKNG